MENLSIYRWVMKYGHLQTDPAEEDTSAGGDPAAGTVYHPALDAADWAKFSGPVTALLPRASSSQCFSGASFDVTCAAPQSLTTVDFFLAGSFLAGAADKTGRITPDLLQYLNRILKIPVDTPETLAALNTLPALIRDEGGVITPATPGLPAPADERFVDFAVDSYLRSDWFSKTVLVLQESGGVWTPTTVNLMTWLNFINGPMTTTALVMPAFVASSNDSLRTVQFLHEYEIPSDLWATPIATTTVVTPVVTGYSSVNQNVVLTATVTSQNLTTVSGSVTFSVRTAALAAVGVPVTAPVLSGVATGTFVLPAGTIPQVLTISAVFTPSGAFAASQGTGTLTVVLAPTVTTVMPAGVPLSASPVDVALTASVSASLGDVVNEGSLLFTVRDSGNAVVGVPVSGPVTTGSVTATFTVPGGLSAQLLTIVGAYQGTTHYAASTGSNQLAVGCLPITILPAVLPQAVVGQPYNQTFTSGGVAPKNFSLSGTLPPGLSFVTDTIGGVPTTSGAFSFTIDVTDAVGCTGSRNYTLDVQQLWAMVTGSGLGMEGTVRLLKPDGTVPTGITAPTQFIAFPQLQFMNGVRVAMGDITGDGTPETLVTLGPGGGPQLRVFDGETGLLIRDFWAFDSWSGGGAFVATGDVNKDGVSDIVVSQGWGTPQIRVFSGADMTLMYDFSAGSSFGGSGARVAAGDVDGDGYADIFAASGQEVAPVIRVFSGATGAMVRQVTGFDANLPGGLFVAAGDVNGDGKADIIAGADEGTGPRIRVFDGVTLTQLRLFDAFEPWRLTGVRVASRDLNGDGKAEIITAPGPGGSPEVRIFDGNTGLEITRFLAYAAGYTGGVYVGSGR